MVSFDLTSYLPLLFPRLRSYSSCDVSVCFFNFFTSYHIFFNTRNTLCPLSMSAAREAVVHIEVSDDGLGISNENQRCIFDPYVQVNNIHGTGLGLAVVRQVTDLFIFSDVPQLKYHLTLPHFFVFWEPVEADVLFLLGYLHIYIPKDAFSCLLDMCLTSPCVFFHFGAMIAAKRTLFCAPGQREACLGVNFALMQPKCHTFILVC